MSGSILNSQFSILNSQFSILNSQFSILNSQFSILAHDTGIRQCTLGIARFAVSRWQKKHHKTPPVTISSHRGLRIHRTPFWSRDRIFGGFVGCLHLPQHPLLG
jgi:hypothetical protein